MSLAPYSDSIPQAASDKPPEPTTFWGRTVKHFNQVLDNTALVLFILLLAVASLQVISRYVLVAPLPWTEELARFLLVWVTFWGQRVSHGASYTSRWSFCPPSSRPTWA